MQLSHAHTIAPSGLAAVTAVRLRLSFRLICCSALSSMGVNGDQQFPPVADGKGDLNHHAASRAVCEAPSELALPDCALSLQPGPLNSCGT